MTKQMKNRSQLLLSNTQIMQALIPPLVQYSPKAILINVSNPVDALTYQIGQIASQYSCHINWQRVIGTGTFWGDKYLKPPVKIGFTFRANASKSKEKSS